MAPRPTWKGYLKLSLVSCAVALYTASSTSSRIRLNIINRESGNRIRNRGWVICSSFDRCRATRRMSS